MCASLVFGVGNHAYAVATAVVDQEIEIIVSLLSDAPKAGTSVTIIYDTANFQYVKNSLRWLPEDAPKLFGFNSDKWNTTEYEPEADTGSRVDIELSALGIDDIADKTGAQVRFSLNNKITKSSDALDLYSIKLKAIHETAITESTFGTYSSSSYPSTYRIVYEGENSSASPYTVAATTVVTGVQVSGNPFDVDVTLTADPTTSGYASVQAELTYDPDLVTPYLEELEDVSDSEPPGTLTITYGPSNGGEVGAGVALATIPFEPKAAGTAVFSVSEGATVTLAGSSDDEDLEIQATPGSDLEVEITAQLAVLSDYTNLPSGYKLLKYGTAKADYGYTYNDSPMYWSSKLNTYLFIVEESDYDRDGITAGASADDAKELAYDGDVSGDGKIRISDAQIVYDIVNAHTNYQSIDGLSVEARLRADVNGDGEVTADDITVIKNIIHGIS
jgi:hypothetical protein